jgi:hypothetical protein
LAVQESLDLHDNGTDYQRYYPGTLVEAQPAAETVEQEASKKSLPFSSVFAESGAVLDVDPATGTVRTLDGTYTSLKAAGMTEL